MLLTSASLITTEHSGHPSQRSYSKLYLSSWDVFTEVKTSLGGEWVDLDSVWKSLAMAEVGTSAGNMP